MRGQKNMAQTYNPGQVSVEIALTIGNSGVVASAKGQGLADLAPYRSAQGQYTINLLRQYRGGLVGFRSGMKRAAGATLQADIASGDGSASTTLVVETRVAAGTATDPANGDVLYLEFVLDETGQVK